MAILTLREDTFESEVLQSSGLVLVDFYADWCGPCRLMAPILDALSEEHPEYKIAKVNVDREPGLASAFSVTSIPTLIVFRDGKPLKTVTGARPKAQLLSLLQEV